jgi:hypothetical protein
VLVLSFYPDIALFVNAETGIGYIFIVSSTIAITIIYCIYHLRKLYLFQEDKSLAKTYLVLIASAVASSIVMNFR